MMSTSPHCDIARASRLHERKAQGVESALEQKMYGSMHPCLRLGEQKKIARPTRSFILIIAVASGNGLRSTDGRTTNFLEACVSPSLSLSFSLDIIGLTLLRTCMRLMSRHVLAPTRFLGLKERGASVVATRPRARQGTSAWPWGSGKHEIGTQTAKRCSSQTFVSATLVKYICFVIIVIHSLGVLSFLGGREA